MSDQNPPTITHLAWGEIEVEISGAKQRFKDCLIWPAGAREWDWNETGTSHSRGIQIADVQELLEKGAGVIVLSRGQRKRLRVARKARTYLEQHDIPFHVEETGAAVERFNLLSQEGRAVGGLFHTTC